MGDFVCDAMLNYIANQVCVDGSGGAVPLCPQVWTVAIGAALITLTLPGTTNVISIYYPDQL